MDIDVLDISNLTPTDHPPPLKIFTLFPLLPTEIRLTIFSYACRTTRNITLELDNSTHPSLPSTLFLPRYYSSTPPPALLHTSREARKQALCHYSLSFPTVFQFSNPSITISTPPRIYINFPHDRLILLRPLQFGRIMSSTQIQPHLSTFLSTFQSLLLTNNLTRLAINVYPESFELFTHFTPPIPIMDQTALEEEIVKGIDCSEITLFEFPLRMHTAGETGLEVMKRKAEVGFCEEKKLPRGEGWWEGVRTARRDEVRRLRREEGVVVREVEEPVMWWATIGVVDERGVVDSDGMNAVI